MERSWAPAAFVASLLLSLAALALLMTDGSGAAAVGLVVVATLLDVAAWRRLRRDG
ncbi:MAG: hypothetical protein M3P46_06765 [Actinomycetota bacterium]|nr:hypothetical protein [Actinomycetota bacterium]